MMGFVARTLLCAFTGFLSEAIYGAYRGIRAIVNSCRRSNSEPIRRTARANGTGVQSQPAEKPCGANARWDAHGWQEITPELQEKAPDEWKNPLFSEPRNKELTNRILKELSKNPVIAGILDWSKKGTVTSMLEKFGHKNTVESVRARIIKEMNQEDTGNAPVPQLKESVREEFESRWHFGQFDDEQDKNKELTDRMLKEIEAKDPSLIKNLEICDKEGAKVLFRQNKTMIDKIYNQVVDQMIEEYEP